MMLCGWLQMQITVCAYITKGSYPRLSIIQRYFHSCLNSLETNLQVHVIHVVVLTMFSSSA